MVKLELSQILIFKFRQARVFKLFQSYWATFELMERINDLSSAKGRINWF